MIESEPHHHESISETHRQFGLRVKELRRERGMTQESLAEKIGVDRSYMGFVERGERNVTLDKIEWISRAFGISLRDLF